MAQTLVHLGTLATGPSDSGIFILRCDGIIHPPRCFGLGLGTWKTSCSSTAAGSSIRHGTLASGGILKAIKRSSTVHCVFHRGAGLYFSPKFAILRYLLPISLELLPFCTFGYIRPKIIKIMIISI